MPTIDCEIATEALVARLVTLPLTLSPCGDYQQAVSDVELLFTKARVDQATLSERSAVTLRSKLRIALIACKKAAIMRIAIKAINSASTHPALLPRSLIAQTPVFMVEQSFAFMVFNVEILAPCGHDR